MRTLALTVLLLLSAGPGRAQDPEAPVRLVPPDGGAVEGVLRSADGDALIVVVDGEPRRVERASLRAVVFLPPIATNQDGIDVAPRCEWRYAAPLERVLADLAGHAGRPVEVEPHLQGEVRVYVRDGTWRDALRAVATSLRAGAHVGDSEARLMTTVRAPFRIVFPRELPTPTPLAVVPWERTEFNGLKWLASVQEPDGRWSASAPGAAPGPGDTAVTALAILAYLGNGHTHRFGTHKRTVAAALTWLKAQGALDATASASPTLDRALRLMALAESHAVSRDYTLRPLAVAALEELLRRRVADSGWGLDVHDPPDAFSTAHAVLALKACRTAGIELDAEPFLDARRFLTELTDETGLVGFRAPGEGLSLTLGEPEAALPLPLFTGGAVIARIFTGERRSVDALRSGRDRLMQATPEARRPDPAYWWLATYAMFQMGGEEWKRWTKELLAAVLLLQRDEPSELAGSWDPAGLWGQLGGRVASTAVSCLTLEIYYRYERAMQQD